MSPRSSIIFDDANRSISSTKIKEEGINPEYIQLGNEITNGMLWPFGKLSNDTPRKNYENLAKILQIISKSARKWFKSAKLIVHLERSFDKEIYKEFLENIVLKYL
mgnify:CR=1 FL=1